MAPHVAEGAGAEVEPLAPLAGMVVARNERPLWRHAQPEIPVEACRDRVFLVRARLAVAPVLAAPRVHFLHLPDRPAVDHLHHGPMYFMRMDLNPHLRDDFLLFRHSGQLTSLENRL